MPSRLYQDQHALLLVPRTSLALLTMGCQEASGISNPSWLIMQSNNTQPVKNQIISARMTQESTEHKHLSSQVTRKGFWARIGSLKEKSGRFWKEWCVEGMLSGETHIEWSEQRGREGKYGYGLSFRQALSHSMESSGPKELVREPVSKVLILQARRPVQSPEPTLKKKWWHNNWRQRQADLWEPWGLQVSCPSLLCMLWARERLSQNK